jgi:hypothetical protein
LTIRRLYHVSIFAVATLGILALCVQQFVLPFNRSLFLPYWDLGEFQTLFVGELPYDATDITYNHDGLVALLTFESSNETADRFASQFCYGVLVQGYDPFNAEHSSNPDDGHLVMVDYGGYYFSWSPDTPMHHFGNRCFDSRRGGVNQILVEKNEPSHTVVKVQISGSPMNHRYYVAFDSHGIVVPDPLSLEVGIPVAPIGGRFTDANAWQFEVEPRQPYEAILQLTDPNDPMAEDYLAQISVAPARDFTDNLEYRETFWAENSGRMTGDGLRVTFDSSPSGTNWLRVFWYSRAETEYSLIVRPVPN